MIDRIKGIINVEWEKIKPIQPDDVKINTNINALKKSLKKHGFSLPFAVWKDDNVIYCVDGHTRVKALKELKHEGEEVPDKLKAFEIDAKDRKEAVEILVEVFNQKHNPFDNEVLVKWLKVEQVEVQDLDVINTETSLSDNDITPDNKSKLLSDKFIVPPFSILDTKQGYWQQRKNYWLSLGIKSELGRDEGSTYAKSAQAPKFYEVKSELKKKGLPSGTDDVYNECIKRGYKLFGTENGSTSIFDPVLCELAYKWFNVPNGKILDCFAGGSVRGIVAAKLGYEYLGNDLRQEQIDANRINAKEVLQDAEIYPTWTCGDSLNIDTIAKGYEADLIFSCPPYADLEVYSDLKEDISNMPYKDFISVYREIIRKSCEMLKQDRFAVFVVGDVRDKKGFYQNFVSDTIMAFWNCGVILYNEMILVNVIGSGAMRAGKQFINSRKVVKHHQNVLVFYKGNPKNIKANYPELDLSYINEEIESE